MAQLGNCSIAFNRFAGSTADEIAIRCRPEGSSTDPARQAESTYRKLAALLAAQQASFHDLTRETLFLRDIRRDLPPVLDARARSLAEIGQGAAAPPPAFIQQAPVEEHASFVLTASAVVPRQRADWSVHDVRGASPCKCEGCARSAARLVRLGDRTSLHTTNIYGDGADAFTQACNMFHAAQRLLENCGMGFHDVVRTWIHLRDIDRDYYVLNRARREFFRHCGIQRRPASTGVEGTPLPDAHDFSMTLHAVKSSVRVDVTPMSTPSLNEAWIYGADFSRGLRIAGANQVTLCISGTASIDDAGRTVHVGNFAAQADCMLDHIASLLARQKATFADLVSAVVYLRNPADAPALQSLLRRRGFNGFPCTLVAARLCRPELLCEAEAVAMLSPVGGV